MNKPSFTSILGATLIICALACSNSVLADQSLQNIQTGNLHSRSLTTGTYSITTSMDRSSMIRNGASRWVALSENRSYGQGSATEYAATAMALAEQTISSRSRQISGQKSAAGAVVISKANSSLNTSTEGITGSGSTTLGIAGTGAPTLGIAGTGAPTLGIAGTGAPTLGIAGTGAPTLGIAGTGTPSKLSGNGHSTQGIAGTGAPSLGIAGTGNSTLGIAGTGSPLLGIAGTGAPTLGIAGTGFSITGIAGTGSP